MREPPSRRSEAWPNNKYGNTQSTKKDDEPLETAGRPRPIKRPRQAVRPRRQRANSSRGSEDASRMARHHQETPEASRFRQESRPHRRWYATGRARSLTRTSQRAVRIGCNGVSEDVRRKGGARTKVPRNEDRQRRGRHEEALHSGYPGLVFGTRPDRESRWYYRIILCPVVKCALGLH